MTRLITASSSRFARFAGNRWSVCTTAMNVDCLGVTPAKLTSSFRTLLGNLRASIDSVRRLRTANASSPSPDDNSNPGFGVRGYRNGSAV